MIIPLRAARQSSIRGNVYASFFVTAFDGLHLTDVFIYKRPFGITNTVRGTVDWRGISRVDTGYFGYLANQSAFSFTSFSRVFWSSGFSPVSLRLGVVKLAGI